MRRGSSFLTGVVLGAVMFLLGGVAVVPPAPPCAGCAVLGSPYGGCDEAVQGGWICP